MSNSKQTSLGGKVCVVTGATRGIGKGIALQLAEKGAKVYITGRTLDRPKDSSVGGSLKDTATEIEARGGTCIPIQCDHSNDSDIKHLFETVNRENDGQLDILVNNAFSAVNKIYEEFASGRKFWDQAPEIWDDINNVGLRNHYVCSVYAARMMVPRKRGLIVNISSGGGLRYLFNAAYGIGKEACDRMAADCGHELRKHNVAFVSLWPGPVSTEIIISKFKTDAATTNAERQLARSSKSAKMFDNTETPEFAGQCIAGLAADTDLMKMSGKILLTADLGRRYGLKDVEGHSPQDMTQLKTILGFLGYKKLAAITPGLLRIPKWLFALGGNKFY